jgi:hypothetical protein
MISLAIPNFPDTKPNAHARASTESRIATGATTFRNARSARTARSTRSARNAFDGDQPGPPPGSRAVFDCIASPFSPWVTVCSKMPNSSLARNKTGASTAPQHLVPLLHRPAFDASLRTAPRLLFLSPDFSSSLFLFVNVLLSLHLLLASSHCLPSVCTLHSLFLLIPTHLLLNSQVVVPPHLA